MALAISVSSTLISFALFHLVKNGHVIKAVLITMLLGHFATLIELQEIISESLS